MIKKIQYLGISIILLFCSWFHLPAGQIELIKQVSLDDLGILKPTLIKAHLGKIYIYDDGGKSFFIINNDLKVIKKFGKTGLGPGEYRTPLGFGFFNDCLWLMDTYGKKINYDLNGKFIGEKKFSSYDISLIVEQLDADRYFMIENQAFENRDINRTLVFINGLERINLLEIKLESNFTFDIESRVNFLFSASKNSGYLVPSDKQYYIKRFDIDKKAFAGEIEKKDFQRIKYTEMEIAEINDKFKKMRENNPILQNINLKMPVLKPAIKQIYADENENLYIISPTNHEGQYSLDLYDKSLKYRDSFLIPLTGLFYPTVDSIYLVIFDDKAGLQVYSLK